MPQAKISVRIQSSVRNSGNDFEITKLLILKIVIELINMASNAISINGSSEMTWIVPDSKMEQVIELLNTVGIKTKWIITSKEEEAKTQDIIETKTEWIPPQHPNEEKSAHPLGNMLKKINSK